MESTNPTTDFFTVDAQRFRSQYERKPSFRDRLALFSEAIQSTTHLPAQVLDFGCGPGIIASRLAELGYHVIGVDGSEGMIAAAREHARQLNLAGAQFELIDAATYTPAPERFDAIVCSSVIEYLEDDIALLRKLAVSLKTGGHLAVSVPDASSVAGNMEDALRTFSRRDSGQHLRYSLRRYGRSGFSAQLRDLGLEPIRWTRYEFPFLGTLGVRLSRVPGIGVMMLVVCRKVKSTS